MIILESISDEKLYACLINRIRCKKNKALLAAIYADENADGEPIHRDFDALEHEGAAFDWELATTSLQGYKI